jgi:hypothetical protein
MSLKSTADLRVAFVRDWNKKDNTSKLKATTETHQDIGEAIINLNKGLTNRSST